MNRHELEAVSALLDGAAGEEEADAIGARVSSDEGLKACWARYSLISDALRGSLPAYMDPGFAARVRRALDREPPLAARTERVVPRGIAGWPAVALAAGVAAVAALGWLGGERPAASAGGARLATVDAAPKHAPAPLAARATTATREAPASRWDDYLVTYSAHRARAGVPTTLPYARIAAYENPQ